MISLEDKKRILAKTNIEVKILLLCQVYGTMV